VSASEGGASARAGAGGVDAAGSGDGDVKVHLFTKGAIARREPLPFADPHGIAHTGDDKRRALLANPLSTSPDDPAQLLGTKGDTVVARLDLVPGEVSVDGAPAKALWTSQLYVHPEHRGSLLAISLVMKMQRLSPTCMVCSVSQAAVPFFRKMKWVDFELPRYVHLLRSRSVVERYLGKGPWQRAAARALDLGLRVHGRAVTATTAIRARSLEDVETPRTSKDLAPRLAEAIPGAACHRSAAWADWLLGHTFQEDPRLVRELHEVRDRSGALAGYFLIKARFFEIASARALKNIVIGSVMDWRTFDPERLDEATLVLLAARALARRRVDAIEICAADAATGRTLRQRGFAPAGVLHVMFRASAKSPLADPRFRRLSSWNLRPAEGDNYFF